MAPPVKVLCVDDEPGMAQTIALLLERAGCEVQACQDGRAALALAETFCPDVCVLDLRMPGIDGMELASRLREQAGREVRCIALTALWDIDAQHRTHNVGFDGHLVKPVEAERLVEAVLGCPAEGPAANG